MFPKRRAAVGDGLDTCGADRLPLVWGHRPPTCASARVTRVWIVWWQRVWRCDELGCVRRTFVEQVLILVARRGSIATSAVGWVIGQLRREHATVHGLARQLGTSWKTVWRAVEPELNRLAANEPRFEKSPRSVSMSTSGITQIPASAARRN